jgi:hypothetical protein
LRDVQTALPLLRPFDPGDLSRFRQPGIGLPRTGYPARINRILPMS